MLFIDPHSGHWSKTLSVDLPVDGKTLNELSLAEAHDYLARLYPGTRWQYSHTVGGCAVFQCDNVTDPHKQLQTLDMWTVYKNPKDFPNQYVARLFHNDQASNQFTTSPEYDELIRALPPGLHRLERSPGDDPCIMETWL